MIPLKKDEITPEWFYLNRRQFLRSAALVGAGAVLAACAPGVTPTPEEEAVISTQAGASTQTIGPDGEELTPYESITTYNNFYEFSLFKEKVADLAKDYNTDNWQIEVSGLVKNPTTFTMQEILDNFEQEERIYRLRCVEGWSMVIPWVGFSLSKLLDVVEPTADAQYVRFESDMDEKQMPNVSKPTFPWPYQEGLRLDEAQNELAILATGLYGKPMPGQNGAPIRMVVPWKYGFKSAKSIKKIELVAQQPDTFWNTSAPNEYGFYSNVNPNVPHPRWMQDSERRIGELKRRTTLMFNGYEDEVAYLYEGMDLKINY